jgi:ribitol 2-dehydrogenase
MTRVLEGKIAAVTGAASGIGLASSKALIDAGATVVMVDYNEETLSEQASQLGEKAIPQVTNLLDAASCDAMVPEILRKTGRIDILHCNAGSYVSGDLTEATSSAIDRMLNLNINAVMKNVHDVIPHMSTHGGDIIVTSSCAGYAAVPWEPVYSSSKWAINCFVQTMRRQLIKRGIRMGQISPGPVHTALLADWTAERLKAVKDSGSLMDPNEVADAVMYMLSRPRNVTIRDVVIFPTNFDF